MFAILRNLFVLSLPLIVSVALADDSSPTSDDQPSGAKQVEKQADKQAENKRGAAKQPEKVNRGDKKAADKQTVNKKKADKPSDSQREEAVFVFVRQHHPDLVELLQRLKATKTKEYQQAVKELSRDAQRLEAARERDPERYGLDLRAWQLDSRIRLLTAKLSLEDRPELQEDLKAALTDRAEVRLAQRQLERDRAATRLKSLDEEIAKLTTNRDVELKQTFDRLLRVAERARLAKDKAKGATEKASGDRRQASGSKEKPPAANETSSPPANEVNTSKAPVP